MIVGVVVVVKITTFERHESLAEWNAQRALIFFFTFFSSARIENEADRGFFFFLGFLFCFYLVWVVRKCKYHRNRWANLGYGLMTWQNISRWGIASKQARAKKMISATSNIKEIICGLGKIYYQSSFSPGTHVHPKSPPKKVREKYLPRSVCWKCKKVEG